MCQLNTIFLMKGLCVGGGSDLLFSVRDTCLMKPMSLVQSIMLRTPFCFSPGEPVSVTVGSEDSTVGLAKLSPGSTYEVSVISVLGLDESDPINDFVTTRKRSYLILLRNSKV